MFNEEFYKIVPKKIIGEWSKQSCMKFLSLQEFTKLLMVKVQYKINKTEA